VSVGRDLLTFSGNDEGGRVGTEVEEELSDNVACKEAVLANLVVAWNLVSMLLQRLLTYSITYRSP
jgi:hypothetical protein